MQLHLIVDNYGTHKHPRVQAWLKRHPRFQLCFTPGLFLGDGPPKTSLGKNSLPQGLFIRCRLLILTLIFLESAAFLHLD